MIYIFKIQFSIILIHNKCISNTAYNKYVVLYLLIDISLTSNGAYTLQVRVWDHSDVLAVADYSQFSVGDEASHFQLTVGGYSSEQSWYLPDSLSEHNGNMFATKDDNPYNETSDCPAMKSAGWW